jgi:hypothetical protein
VGEFLVAVEQDRQKQKQKPNQRSWLASGLRPENLIPGLIIGFFLGLFVELPRHVNARLPSKPNLGSSTSISSSSSEEFKMVGESIKHSLSFFK